MARSRRLKLKDRPAVYHCICRVVARDRLLDERARTVLQRQIWQVADFCGVEVLCHCLMSNHFHLLVRVPVRQPITDEELARRWAVLYGKNRREEAGQLEYFMSNHPAAAPEKERLRRRMGDLSQYLKELKQRFTIWFNKKNSRLGTVWTERFKSILIDENPHVWQVLAAYITLNPVRAGLVREAQNYRWCSYAEAVRGRQKARHGLMACMKQDDWRKTASSFRLFLEERGAIRRVGKAPPRPVLDNRSAPPTEEISTSGFLGQRIGDFSTGASLGTASFISDIIGTMSGGWRLKRPPHCHALDRDGWPGLTSARSRPGLGGR